VFREVNSPGNQRRIEQCVSELLGSNQAKQEAAVAEKSQEDNSAAASSNFRSQTTRSGFKIHHALKARHQTNGSTISHQPSPADFLRQKATLQKN
jgi:hypothetical protein